MRYFYGFNCVLALSLLPLVGCAADGGTGGSGGSAGIAGSAGTGGVAGAGGVGGIGGTGGAGGFGGSEPATANVAFVTSAAITPSELGGLSGADSVCAAAALDAGLPSNTYLAWLSTTTVSPTDASRLGNARGWVRPDGKAFADTTTDLVNPPYAKWYPLGLDEFGQIISAFTLTATDRLGNLEGDTCSDWQGTDDGYLIGGDTTELGEYWTYATAASDACDTPHLHLACFGADYDTPVEPEPMIGRRAFISTGGLVPGTGITGADDLCNAEAAAQGWTGSGFKALLATETETAISRMNLEGPPWVRVDGLPLVNEATDLESGELLVPPMQRADGTYVWDSIGVWAGADGLDSLGIGTSCESWTTDLGMGVWTQNTSTSDFFSIANPQDCQTEGYVFCFEQ